MVVQFLESISPENTAPISSHACIKVSWSQASDGLLVFNVTSLRLSYLILVPFSITEKRIVSGKVLSGTSILLSVYIMHSVQANYH